MQGIAADVSTASGCRSVLEAFLELDLLVNNMGIFPPQPFGAIRDADWMHFFEANVLNGARLAPHDVEGMHARNCGAPRSCRASRVCSFRPK